MIDIENFDSTKRLSSPRSLKAMKMCGIEMNDLFILNINNEKGKI